MRPYVFGMSTYFLCWGLAAISGLIVATRLGQAAGLSASRSFLASAIAIVPILVGAKLLFLLEREFFPADSSVPILDGPGALMWQGFRLPGGIVLLTLSIPATTHWLRLPPLRSADVLVPSLGIVIFVARMGCFFNGCCFGPVSHAPWAMSFPRGARVFDWQVLHGLIPGTASRTLPVEPLQLYFAVLGLALYALGLRWQRTQHLDGEVWLKFCLLFFGGTLLLEFLRAETYHLNLIINALSLIATAIVFGWRRHLLARSPDAIAH